MESIIPDLTPEERQRAKEFLIKSKVYRWMALILAITGLLVVAIVYIQKYGGDIAAAVQNPSILIVLLIPFLPSFILSLKASSADKKFRQIWGEEPEDDA